ncbi:hypothetical protein [Bradyrhizobium sp. Cp5.3]|uniref:hypothetical protein n=1 Tax=Bradyrhizobium sp. Cp5.3 TaxID=443598 RepID=UPI0004188245|nr:hypothetical protein [Bradyrhizobium sp. Cp5.3]
MSKEQHGDILEISAQFPPLANGGPPEMRAWFEAINEQTPIPDDRMIERGSGSGGRRPDPLCRRG